MFARLVARLPAPVSPRWLALLVLNPGCGRHSNTLEHYSRIWSGGAYVQIFITTFQTSALVTLICILLGYPLAYCLAQIPQRWSVLLMLGVLVPFWTSLLVRTYAWLVLLQRRGIVNSMLVNLGLIDQPLALVNNLTGTIIGMVHVMIPFLVLPLYSTLRNIDGTYVKAAASLGASPTKAFWQVYFPLSVPGLIAGTVLTFILCLGFYITPAVLGRRARAVHRPASSGVGKSVSNLGPGKCAWRGPSAADHRHSSRKSDGVEPLAPFAALGRIMESHITHWQRWWLYGLTVLTIIFLVLPSLVVIPMSFSGSSSLAFPPPNWSLRWYENYFRSSQWLTATWIPVQVSFFTALIATPIGVAAAYALHVGTFMLKPAIYGMLIASLTVPVILIAVGAYFAFAQVGLVNTRLSLVLSDTLLAVPFVLLTVSAGLKGYDMNQHRQLAPWARRG